MKKPILFLIFIIVAQVSFAQNKALPKRQKKKIELFADHLSGTWKFLGNYENGNLQTEESVWEQKAGDSIATYYKITKKGYFKLTYQNDSLIGSQSSRLAEINLDFDSSGKGSYDELVIGYFESYEYNELLHPPIPELVFYKKRLVILMTEMVDQYYVKFKLKNDNLILQRIGEKTKKKYIRIK